MLSRVLEAMIGAASARGDEIEDGVEERVWNEVLGCHWYTEMGAGAGIEANATEGVAIRSVEAANGIGDAEARGVGSEEGGWPEYAYSEVVLEVSSSA